MIVSHQNTYVSLQKSNVELARQHFLFMSARPIHHKWMSFAYVRPSIRTVVMGKILSMYGQGSERKLLRSV